MLKCQHGSLWRSRHPTHLRRAKKLRASSASSASWPKDLGDRISYSGTAVSVVCLQASVPLWVLLVPWYKEAKRNKRSQCVPVSRRVQMLPLLFHAGMKMFATGYNISTILHCPNALPPRQCTATMFVLRVACQMKTSPCNISYLCTICMYRYIHMRVCWVFNV